jgi:D-alanine-D-alanine ligase
VRIAFVFNLQLEPSEEQAEFDTPATVRFVTGALERLGHVVEPIDAGRPLETLVAHLRAFEPELVFNSAEGDRGSFREAFFPSLYEELGMPYTGSGPWACAVTLDKHLTKLTAAAAGVATPAARLVRSIEEPFDAPAPPLIVKPNYEGSSKGIDRRAIVDDGRLLPDAVAAALGRFPDGVLVEQFVTGRDLSVGFLEGTGVLAGYEYEFADATAQMYDYELKHLRPDDVEVRVPARLTPAQAAELEAAAGGAFGALRIRDLGRADFRLGDDGRLWFLEVNPLPSLEEGAGIYSAAALAGLRPDDVIASIVESALRRNQAPVSA